MIKQLQLTNFTAFKHLTADFLPGVNLFIGANGTGKTHILKALYAIESSGQYNKKINDRLSDIFLPTQSVEHPLSRLVRKKSTSPASVSVTNKNGETGTIEINKNGTPGITGSIQKKQAVYIPVKEMLANAPGFRSLYSLRETHFEGVYADIIDRAFLLRLKQTAPELEKLLQLLAQNIGGKIITKNEEFYLEKPSGEIEFTLVAEGIRKLALLWILIKNGSLAENSLLFWDEPETNLNPSMIPVIVEVLLALQEIGAQIFIATHSYVLCKEFELQRKACPIRYFSLYPEDDGDISLKTADAYHLLSPNRITDQFTRMYGMEIERSLGSNNG